MGISSDVYPAIGAITAALIAGAISFVSTILSKEQKTSEFRQAWIDSLREELSEFFSHIYTIATFLRMKSARGGQIEQLLDYFEERDDEVCKAEMMYTRIMLRLNPKEHQKLFKALREVHSLILSKKILEKDHVAQLSNELMQESRTVLKYEWKRVKRGEFAFMVTKYVSLMIFLASVAATILYVYGKMHIAITFAL